jgi:hypothetical protein
MIDFIIDENIATAKTLHSDFYKKQEYLEAAKEKIFPACGILLDIKQWYRYPVIAILFACWKIISTNPYC